MIFQFTLRLAYGQLRFYPRNKPSETFLAFIQRKCLTGDEIKFLQNGDFTIEVFAESSDKAVGGGAL